MTCVRERTCGANWYHPRMAWNSDVAGASRCRYGSRNGAMIGATAFYSLRYRPDHVPTLVRSSMPLAG